MEVQIRLKPLPRDLGPDELKGLVPYKIVSIKNANGHNAANIGDIVIRLNDIWSGYILFNVTKGKVIRPDYNNCFTSGELLFRRSHEVQEINLFGNYEERP